jgi:hypothetical protein
MVMIPMECPKCGRRGSVPSNRINTPFNCKSCNAPFYLTTAGDAVSGEPPVAKDPRDRKSTATKAKREVDFSAFTDLFSSWQDMPSGDRVRKLAIVAVFLGFIAILYHYMTMNRTDPLVERGAYVARAFADNDANRIRAVASSGTEEDAAIWLEKTREMLGMKGNARDFHISSAIYSGGKSEGGAILLATYTPLNAGAVQPKAASKNDPPSSGSQMLAVNMFFVPDSQGGWKLDGRGSLSSATSQLKGAQPKARR